MNCRRSYLNLRVFFEVTFIMNSSFLYNFIGYLGTALVIISMMMPSVVKLRLFNLAGSIVCIIYGILIHAYPTALMNVALAGINIFYLIRLTMTENHYEVIDCRSDTAFLDYFFTCHADDIRKYFPEFQKNVTVYDTAFMVCMDTIPAGVLLGRKKDENTLDIVLDYSTPAYRDCSVGSFLYDHLPELGIERVELRVPTQNHDGYLRKMKFRKLDGIYVKEL